MVPFPGDLPLEVERDIDGEVFFGGAGEPDAGQEAVVQGALRIEGLPQLRCREGVQMAHARASAQKVHAAAAQFARTGTGQEKFPALSFDQAVQDGYPVGVRAARQRGD